MRLTAHGWDLQLLPELGGSIGHLRLGGEDILRPAPANAASPVETAGFPLLPYANRIAHGRFRQEGRDRQLPRNAGEHPHSLHGVGWQREWEGEVAGEAELVLRLPHPGDESWPWPFRAEQRFRLTPTAFHHSLSLQNLAEVPVPVGLGFHPYFPRHAESQLTARVSAAWEIDATCLPLQRTAADRFGDWAAGGSLNPPFLIDNAHEGWDGSATISRPGQTLLLLTEGTGVLHLYVPPGEDFFCVEPVTHLPDAVNRGGMALLAPGATASISMALSLAG